MISVNHDHDTELRKLIMHPDAYSEEQIKELRKHTVSMGNLGADWRDRA